MSADTKSGDVESKDDDVQDDEIIQEMKNVRGPFAGTRELSERLGISRQQMNDRLRSLKDDGILDRKQCGSGFGWWIREYPA